MHRHALTPVVAVTAALTALLAGCGAGPSDRPGVAVERPRPAAGPSEGPLAPAGPAELSAPRRDLGWVECRRDVFAEFGLDPGGTEVLLDCASFPVRLDPTGRVAEVGSVELTRARLPQVPADAPPLVLTTGSGQPSSRALAVLAARGASPLLAERPVVAVDRRGVGRSTPVTCLGRALREEQIDLGTPTQTTVDAVEQAQVVGRESTIACTDQLDPIETLFTAANAAFDLEELRKAWDSDSLALVGVGDGATVALAYAATYGDRVARLVLDAPPAPGGDALVQAEQAAKGAENAVATFLAQCAATDCALGDDPGAVVADLLRRAEAGQLRPLTPGAVAVALTGVLGDTRGTAAERIQTLATALADAAAGRTGPLLALSYDMYEVTNADGQFIGRCSDTVTRAAPDQVRERLEQWSADFPFTGRDTLLRQLFCSSWAALPAPPTPRELAAPVLLVDGSQDPRSGSGGARELAGQLTAAGAEVREVSWRGLGHGAVLNSECAAQAAALYAASAELPAAGTICPP